MQPAKEEVRTKRTRANEHHGVETGESAKKQVKTKKTKGSDGGSEDRRNLSLTAFSVKALGGGLVFRTPR